MIYPSRYLMNLLWVAKLFMSLIAKFLHASLPFLASEPKSNSARRDTHTRAYPYAYTYLTQSHCNLHTQIHTCLHDDQHLCPPVHKSIFHEEKARSVQCGRFDSCVDLRPDELRSYYLSMPGPLPLGDFHLFLTDKRGLGAALFTVESKS